MKNNGRSNCTIKFADKALTHLSKHADLNKPEQVKQFIANKQTSNSYKRNLSYAYDKYCQHYKIEWTHPLYKQEPKAIRIPTTAQLEMRIANSTEIMSINLSHYSRVIDMNVDFFSHSIKICCGTTSTSRMPITK